MKLNNLYCNKCSWKSLETEFFTECPNCHSLIEVKYETKNKLIDENYKGELRYHNFLPFHPSNLYQESIYKNLSPLVSSPEISDLLSCNVFIKDETVFPTGTWKDREGITSIDRLVRNNVEKLVLFSSGNTGTALSRTASLIKKSIIELVVPNASRKRIEKIGNYYNHDYINLHFHNGSNDECIDFVSRLANLLNCPKEGGFNNYARREGLKSLTYELLEQTNLEFDWYVQPVAGAIGIYSMFKALKDVNLLDKMPRILGAQAEICAPFVRGWELNAKKLDSNIIPAKVIESDFVRVLRTRAPYDSYELIYKIMKQTRGSFISASDKKILEALRVLLSTKYFKERLEESIIFPGLEPATALAGLINAVENDLIKKGSSIVLNISGAAKPNDLKYTWFDDLIKNLPNNALKNLSLD